MKYNVDLRVHSWASGDSEGHCLIFGINTDKFLSKHMSITELLSVVNQHGSVVIPSHPYWGRLASDILITGDRFKLKKIGYEKNCCTDMAKGNACRNDISASEQA
jgi:hypothetical protein